MAYFDYAANCPTDERVLEEYIRCTRQYYGNPNAFHASGEAARGAIEQASESLAALLGIKAEEIIYTSGASESNNLAIKGAAEQYRTRGKHILIGAFEHNSLVSSALTMQKRGWEIELLEADKQGIVSVEEVARRMRQDTVLVSVAAVDSELGIRQPVEKIAAYLKENHPRCLFHTDAAQAIGKTAVDFSQIDLATISAHKFYGLNGSGLLIKKANIGLVPQIDGGRSTTMFRSGTPETAAIISTALAVQLALAEMEERNSVIEKRYERMIEGLRAIKGVQLNSTPASLKHFINFSVANRRSFVLQQQFAQRGIELSAKSSCCPQNSPSKAVYALYKDRARALSSLRVSLSHLTKEEEIDEFFKAFEETLKENV